MKILGIETSCDETGASVVLNGQWILSNVVASSLKQHQKYGGIIPEIASRRQIELISLVVAQALKNSKTKLKDMDAIAVTTHPGLIGSLLVGISFARALGYSTGKPLIEVDHIKAHVYANFLKSQQNPSTNTLKPKLPAIGLVVSGGHSSIFEIHDFKNFQLLGQTRDDAAGEAFDKVARILQLGYPGGPAIDRLARRGVNNEIRFPFAELPGTNDFSFSGVKTAVLYFVRTYKPGFCPAKGGAKSLPVRPSASPRGEQAGAHRAGTLKSQRDFNETARVNPDILSRQRRGKIWDKNKNTLPVEKIAYAFQNSVVTVLVNKCLAVCKAKRISTLLVGGGVAANTMLRKRLRKQAKIAGVHVFFPPLSLCLDNAAMIAGYGFQLLTKKRSFK